MRTKREAPVTFGAYPNVTLADARKRAGEYLSAARDGKSAEAVDARTRPLTLTVAMAHGEYLETVGGGLRATTTKRKEGMFKTHIESVAGTHFSATFAVQTLWRWLSATGLGEAGGRC